MATLTDRLAEAESAYHDLQIGKAVVRVRDADGSEISYTQANKNSLLAYIQALKNEIAGTVPGSFRPLRVYF